jgi:hypothetical protein
MKAPRSLCSAALAVVLALKSAPALAEQSSAYAAAEAAYVGVDFEGTRSASENALNEGNHDPAETLRLYTLLGIATSTLGQEGEAREAFRRVIGIDPDTGLDKNLSPKVRAPYLEVRGELSAKGKLEPLSARVERRSGRLFVALVDPANIAAGIDVAYRAGSSQNVTHFHLVRGQEMKGSDPVPDTSRVEYTVAVRDGYGNALFRAGSEASPEVLPPAAVATGGEEHPAAAPKRTPYYLAAGILAGAGVAAGATAIYFHVQREKEAREWNGTACEVPGQTRGQQCASVDSQRSKDQNIAIGLYAASGALLLGSVITLLVAPHATTEAARAADFPCVPGVGTIGAACRVAF